MTVRELIQELKKLPMDKFVAIGSPTDDLGVAKQVVEYTSYIEIQSEYDSRDHK